MRYALTQLTLLRRVVLIIICTYKRDRCVVAIEVKMSSRKFWSSSHTNLIYSGHLSDLLVEAGHDVTLLIYEMRSDVREINGTRMAKVIRMRTLSDVWAKAMNEESADIFAPFEASWQRRRGEFVAFVETCEALLKRFDELRPLQTANFDLAIATGTDFCDLGLIRALRVPLHIWTTTGPILDINAWAIGLPPETATVPTVWESTAQPVMSFRERVNNFFRIYLDRLLYLELTYKITQLFRRYVDPQFEHVATIAGESSLLFANIDEHIEPQRALTPRVVPIGGVGLRRNIGRLSDELLAFIESRNATAGFVFFSLGSAIFTSHIPRQTKVAILDAFARFPQHHFIIKVDDEDANFHELAKRYSNIRLVHWIAQGALLAHPKARLFITHGGANSVLEATIHGVPMLVLPVFFDQHRSAQVLAWRNLARILHPNLLTTDRLFDELLHLLRDGNSHAQTAKRFATLHEVKPNTPDAIFVRHVEFVVAQGPLTELRPHSLDLNFFAVATLDVVGLLIVTLAAALYIGFRLVIAILMRSRQVIKLKSA